MDSLELPAGFGWLHAGAWHVAVREECRGVLENLDLADPERLAEGGDRCFSGRGRPSLLTLPDGSRVVLRRYRHGGMLGRLTGNRFAGASRPLGELRATEAARTAGVRVPEILAALHRPVAPALHEGYLLSRLVPAARDLSALLCDGPGERIGGWLRATGGETRRLHDAGIWHADLHVKNVLVDDLGVTLLDFDRARVPGTVPERDRRRNLFRFDRSVVKLSLQGVVVPRELRLHFFAGYTGGRDDPERLLRMGERSQRWHRLAWRLRIR
jgi:tRNA A-37 threonylcarbamoyl transferase component Bud32